MPEPALTSRVNETGEDRDSKKGFETRTEGLGQDISQSVRAA